MTISDKVRQVLEVESISWEELLFMLKYSAITTTGNCNRRYSHWVFLVEMDAEDCCVQNMRRADIVEIGTGKDRQLEEHDLCEGQGCRECGWVGEVCRRLSDKKVPRYEPLGFN